MHVNERIRQASFDAARVLQRLRAGDLTGTVTLLKDIPIEDYPVLMRNIQENFKQDSKVLGGRNPKHGRLCKLSDRDMSKRKLHRKFPNDPLIDHSVYQGDAGWQQELHDLYIMCAKAQMLVRKDVLEMREYQSLDPYDLYLSVCKDVGEEPISRDEYEERANPKDAPAYEL